jgi:hypothetical protein
VYKLSLLLRSIGHRVKTHNVTPAVKMIDSLLTHS